MNLRAPSYVKLERNLTNGPLWKNTVVSGRSGKAVCVTASPKKRATVVVVENASQMLADQAAAAARTWQATLSAPSVK